MTRYRRNKPASVVAMTKRATSHSHAKSVGSHVGIVNAGIFSE